MFESVLAEPGALLEREHEVERVRGALRAVGRRDGLVVAIEGAGGIGKSRLLEFARSRGSELGYRVLGARATELEQGFPFGVVRQLFERLISDADADERERWLSGAAALASDVLTGAPTVVPPVPSPGPAADDPTYAWQHGLYWLASNLAADTPAVLAIDDLQWCDGPSARALAFIARRLSGQPLALIFATRPLDPASMPEAASLATDPAVELIRPEPLTHPAVAVLVGERLAADPDPAFVRACLEVTGGNPFLLGELLDEVSARRFEPTAAAAAQVTSLVPRGVANAVLLRLARLAPSAASLARTLQRARGRRAGERCRAPVRPRRRRPRGRHDRADRRGRHPAGRHGSLRSPDPSHGDSRRPLAGRAGAFALLGVEDPRRAGGTAGPGGGARHADRARRGPEVGQPFARGRSPGAGPGRRRGRGDLPRPCPRRAARRRRAQGAGAGARAGAGPRGSARGDRPAYRDRHARGRRRRRSSTAAIELSGMFFLSGRAREAASILRRAQERLPRGAAGRERARGGAARRQLHLGVGPARSRFDDRRAAGSGWPGA